jgi:DNA polymerase I-like protein with 3'-5' exonuclease and polymerase domains
MLNPREALCEYAMQYIGPVTQYHDWEPGPRFRFWNLDYKAAEVKILAVYTLDATLIAALKAGKDIHSAVGSVIFNKPYEFFEPADGSSRSEEAEILRGKVKAFVFGTMYGRGVGSIAYALKISKDEAKGIQNKIFGMMPAIPAFTKLVELELRHHGMVSTFFGRKKRFPLAADPGCDRELFGSFLRTAANFKIQSTSAEVVNTRMIEINKEIKKRYPLTVGTWMGQNQVVRAVDTKLTVHDSIAGQIDTKAVKKQEFMEFIDYWACKRVNELYPWIPIEFVYDIGFGRSYGEAG